MQKIKTNGSGTVSASFANGIPIIVCGL